MGGSACAAQAVLLRRSLNRQMTELAKEQSAGDTSGLSAFIASFALKYNVRLFRMVHFLITIVVWQHFFQNKFHQQMAAVPTGPQGDGTGVPNYWWKRLVPPIEFGLMHQILFQLALIPITMSRRLLALLSTEGLGDMLPFQDMVKFHIQVGYAFCLIIVASTILFFVFFGKVCSDHLRGLDPLDACSKFKSEIFLTGLIGTLVPTLIVLLTSYFRGRLQYEKFYVAHFFVFVMFLFAALHTFDNEVRHRSKVRSQTIIWFGTSLAIYLTDRIWSLCTVTKCRVLEATPTADRTAVILRLEKPRGFSFQAGQYAQLRIPAIDMFWHPFSIGSGPDANYLTFLIQVQPGKKAEQWTRMLVTDEIISKLRSGAAKVSVQGPYGYPVANMSTSDAVIGVGTGTGVVPMLSLLQQRCMVMSLVGKEALGNVKSSRVVPPKPEAVEGVTATDKTNSKDVSNALSFVQLKYRTRRVREQGAASVFFRSRVRAAGTQRLQLAADLGGWLLVVLETTTVGLFLSFSNLNPIALARWQGTVLNALALTLIVCYAFHVIYRLAHPQRFRRSLWAAFDAVLTVVTCVIFGWWTAYGMFNTVPTLEAITPPTVTQQVLYTTLAAFRIARLMQANPVLRPRSHRMTNTGTTNVLGAEKFELIWACRSADLVKAYIPIVNDLVETMHMNIYGTSALPGQWEAGLGKFVDYSFYVTDKNQDKCDELTKSVQGTPSEGKIKFGRPDIPTLTLNIKAQQLVAYVSGVDGAVTTFNTAVTFCGSPVVAEVCHKAVLASNKLSAVIGYPQFFASFREEFYGFSAMSAKKWQDYGKYKQGAIAPTP